MLPLDKMLTVQKLIQDKVSFRTINIFGVLVYTEEHPYIVKVLRDKDFWASLNARTKNWLLYAIRPDDNYGHLTEKYILPCLGITDSRELPQLIIISIGPNQSFKQRGFHIDDISETSAYHSIEEKINIVTKTASGILPQYQSSTNVYREVIKAIETETATFKWRTISTEFRKLIQTIISLT